MVFATRSFKIWRLEKWWVAFNKFEELPPEGRRYLGGNGWYWRED